MRRLEHRGATRGYRSSHLADVHPDSAIFDQLRLRRVVEIKNIGDNALVQKHDQGGLSQPVIPIATSIGLVGVQGHHVEETVLVFCQTLPRKE